MQHRNLLILLAVIHLSLAAFESSGDEPDDSWLREILHRLGKPRFLLQKAYQLAGDAKPFVDDEETLTLDRSVPPFAKVEFMKNILNVHDNITLEKSIENFQNVLFYAFKPFGCDQGDVWPSYYQLTRENLNCIASTLLSAIYSKSEFTRKYFSRAIHFGLTSKAPIDHRIMEIQIYQFLLPNSDRDWFNKLKTTLENTFWNQYEHSRADDYERNSFLCGSIFFTEEVNQEIQTLYNGDILLN